MYLPLFILFCLLAVVIEMCPTLIDPSNGTVTWDGLTSGSTATYTCDSGYYITGDRVRTCQNGGWTGQAPVCTRMIVIYIVLCAFM